MDVCTLNGEPLTADALVSSLPASAVICCPACGAMVRSAVETAGFPSVPAFAVTSPPEMVTVPSPLVWIPLLYASPLSATALPLVVVTVPPERTTSPLSA